MRFSGTTNRWSMALVLLIGPVLSAEGHMTIRVLLADDHEMLGEGVKALLAGQDGMEVVGEATDGESALDQARLLQPDDVVMDISMPGGGGVTATGKIRAELPGVRVVALSIHSERVYVEAMLHAGASRARRKVFAGSPPGSGEPKHCGRKAVLQRIGGSCGGLC